MIFYLLKQNLNISIKINILLKEEFGVPGIAVGVSKNNQIVFAKGFGYSDVENGVKVTPNTIMRIASISKPITCAIAAKLYELNKLDIDKPINDYVKTLPEFKFKTKSYKLTSRQLMCHLSGIRHYKEKNNYDKNSNQTGDTQYPEFYLNKNFKNTREALDLFINDELAAEPGIFFLLE
jgi:serine beta-lactamase-like protein LACTB